MKKISFALTFAVAIIFVFTACSFNSKYTKQEEEIISFANSQIETTYGVKIDKGRFKYSIGKKVGDNMFDRIKEGDALKVVALSAVLKGKPEKGDVISYSLIYDVETKDIIQINAEFY